MEEIQDFFRQYVADFPNFDGQLIASRYSVPYLSVSNNGEMSLFNSQDEIAAMFQNYLDLYVQKGIRSCRYRDFEARVVEDDVVFATMNWEMLGEVGEMIQSWRESYNLHKVDGQWCIFSSIDHDFSL